VVSNVLKSLYADHVNLDQLLQLIEDEIERIGAGQSEPYLETLTLVLEYCVDYPDHFHHPAEDLIYGALVGRAPELAQKIADITADHETLSRLTRSFSNAVASAIEGGETKPVRTHGLEFLRHYRRHMQIEETDLFSAAEKLLTRSDWSRIETQAKIPLDPLFTEHVREAYLALKQRIVARAENLKTESKLGA
jgi:hemerythrin-like domain-containing protein